MKKFVLLIMAMVVSVASNAQDKTIYGFSMSSPYALLKFTADNPAGATRVGSTNLDPRSGAAVAEDLYVIGMNDDFDPVLYKVDTATGSATKIKVADELPFDMSYDYTSDQMFFVNSSATPDAGGALWTMNLENGKCTLVKDKLGVYVRALAINANGDMYGMTNNGVFVKIDKKTYAVTTIKVTGKSLNYGMGSFQSMDFDRKTGVLYWTYLSADGKATLNTVDVATGEVTEIGTVGSGNGIQTVALNVHYVPSAKGAPAKVSELTATADANGGNSAVIAWINPDKDNQGNDLTDISKVEVLRNDVVVKTLTTGINAGAASSYTDNVTAAGMYKYTVKAYNAVGGGADEFVEVWVGHDIPEAPARCVAALHPQERFANIIAWDVPEKGAHGGYLDAESLKYDVVRTNDNKKIAEGITADYVVDSDLLSSLTRYVYEVVPSNADGTGEKTESNYLVNGPSQTMPFAADFNSWDDAAQYWTVVNYNEDETTFHWYNDYMGMFGRNLFIYEASETLYAADFIVSPPLEFQEGHTYKITVTASNDDIAGYREESFRIYNMANYNLTGAVPLGDEVFTVKHPGEFKDYSIELTVEDDGQGAADELFTSFIGVCATSQYDQGMLLIAKVTVEDLNPSGISDIQNVDLLRATTYDLGGREVKNPGKGIYIRNGRKFVK
ncbi:MAG: hypothetical protein IJ549_01900 [Prevotella sp.]|nr:hypothetical protein [Prevotella sp.]MBQ8706289.1 hypothetical protein [Paludibacteraceae bacterium]